MNMKKWIPWALSMWLMLSAAWPAGASGVLDEAVEQRFLMMDVPVAPVYDETARWFLKRYLTLGRYDASLMLGRAEVWFPVIEQVFEAEGVPVSLKYLAVVESNLQPDALSEAGARGLWQFMPSTARQYGLEVSAVRDERLDPWRATMAAARYLKDLHAEFGDWELVLAAYNCGSGRVLQAIRQARTRNYWHLRPWLPRQTARYVSAFLAAAYVCQYHAFHGLEPRPLPDWMRHRNWVVVQGRLSLQVVSKATGVPMAVLKELNPAWPGGVIWASRQPALLALPEAAFPAFRAWLKDQRLEGVRVNIQPDPETDPIDSALLRLHRLERGETLEQVARRHGIDCSELRAWNLLGTDDKPIPGLWLKLYQAPGTWRSA